MKSFTNRKLKLKLTCGCASICLLHYNDQPHRTEAHSRMEDWLRSLPKSGLRQMCSWERFCTFAREPQRRKVDASARVSIEGVAYEVDPDLAGETVVLWWGLFDNELYVEKDNQRYGPFYPVDGSIPLHRYRSLQENQNPRTGRPNCGFGSTSGLATRCLGQKHRPKVPGGQVQSTGAKPNTF